MDELIKNEVEKTYEELKSSSKALNAADIRRGLKIVSFKPLSNEFQLNATNAHCERFVMKQLNDKSETMDGLAGEIYSGLTAGKTEVRIVAFESAGNFNQPWRTHT